MPKQRTSFNPDWFKQKDCNGHLLGEWCEDSTSSKYQVFCRFCRKTIQCDNRGLSQLLNHARTRSHSDIFKDIVKGTQMTFQTYHGPSSSGSNETSSHVTRGIETCGSTQSESQFLTCASFKENTTKAELLWALKVVKSNFSYNASDDVNDLFSVMFPDSRVASQFSCGPSKLSHLISEATGPHFHEVLIFDINKSMSPFSISYDELTNKQVKKQLDLKIRYWSNEKTSVCVHHLDSYLMGRATGKDISDKIMKSIDGAKLPLKDLITLGSDGPNVNKTVFRTVSEAKKNQDLPALLDVGTCTLHVVHGGFGKGIAEFGEEVVDLVVDLHNFFKLSPVRMEEYQNLQSELGVCQLKFLKHVECRWLTLAPAIERVKSQLTVLKEYFLKELPKRDKKIQDNARFKRIVMCLKTPLSTITRIEFLLSVSKMFETFMNLFQSEEPLIHVLHEHWCLLLKILLGRFVKPEIIKDKSIDELKLMFPCIEKEQSDDDFEIGIETRKTLEKLNLNVQKTLLHGMRKFYHILSGHLLKKLPLHNVILKESRCLSYENRCEAWTVRSIKLLANAVSLVPPCNVDFIGDEWRILQCEQIPDDWNCTRDGQGVVSKRIDHYWGKIFTMKDALDHPKYPELTRLVKAILVLPHGNADVERGFSQTSNYLTNNRTCLSEASISAIQSTKDGLKQHNYQLHTVPFTKDFIKKGRGAHKLYLARLEEEKNIEAERKKQEQEEKEKIKKQSEEFQAKRKVFEKKSQEAKEAIQKEKLLEKQESEAKEEVQSYKSLVAEANERIKNAMKINDRKGLQIAQTMLEAACKKLEESDSVFEKIRNKQKQIQKRKTTMLDYFCASQSESKKPKNS